MSQVGAAASGNQAQYFDSEGTEGKQASKERVSKIDTTWMSSIREAPLIIRIVA